MPMNYTHKRPECRGDGGTGYDLFFTSDGKTERTQAEPERIIPNWRNGPCWS